MQKPLNNRYCRIWGSRRPKMVFGTPVELYKASTFVRYFWKYDRGQKCFNSGTAIEDKFEKVSRYCLFPKIGNDSVEMHFEQNRAPRHHAAVKQYLDQKLLNRSKERGISIPRPARFSDLPSNYMLLRECFQISSIFGLIHSDSNQKTKILDAIESIPSLTTQKVVNINRKILFATRQNTRF